MKKQLASLFLLCIVLTGCGGLKALVEMNVRENNITKIKKLAILIDPSGMDEVYYKSFMKKLDSLFKEQPINTRVGVLSVRQNLDLVVKSDPIAQTYRFKMLVKVIEKPIITLNVNLIDTDKSVLKMNVKGLQDGPFDGQKEMAQHSAEAIITNMQEVGFL
jgi:hypothetical protein